MSAYVFIAANAREVGLRQGSHLFVGSPESVQPGKRTLAVFFSTSSCQTYGDTVYFTTQSHADCINALQFYKVIYVALN